ncbi:MAG TPA: SRPBCC family protein [Anaerolineae bacterium]|nr:SRPBCC family protein [Anaerolineae bacterium]
MNNEYQFVTNWRIRGEREEIAQILAEPEHLTAWWPSVYLQVTELRAGEGEWDIGRVIGLHTKGWLPYTLRWQFEITEVVWPERFVLEAAGDFNGVGVWVFEQDGDMVNVTYDWRIRADKPLLKYGSVVLKPFFRANHHWAMEKGLASLKLELARRRAATAEERAQIPAPPLGTSPWLVLGGLGLLLALIYWWWRD